MSSATVAEVRDLNVGYDGRTIVRNISFDLEPGRALLIMGHNGCGKTTLLRTLFATQAPLAGSARLLDVDVRKSDPHDLLQAGVRFLGQGVRSFDELSVGAHRAVLHKLYGWPQRQRDTAMSATPDSRTMGLLSLGKRRIEALELLRSGTPRLMLLDEPTAGLDAGAAARVLQWIVAARAEGIAFIVVEHNFRILLKVMDSALVIRNGSVRYAGAAAPLLDSGVLADRFM